MIFAHNHFPVVTVTYYELRIRQVCGSDYISLIEDNVILGMRSEKSPETVQAQRLQRALKNEKVRCQFQGSSKSPEFSQHLKGDFERTTGANTLYHKTMT